MFKKIIIFGLLIALALFLFWQNLNAPVGPGAEQQFTVAKGAGISEIAGDLKKQNLIKSAFYFKFSVWRRELSLQAGDYLLSPALSANEIIKLLAAGQALSRENTVKIIEGWNSRDIGASLEKTGAVSSTAFLALAQKPVSAWKFAFSKPEFLAGAPPSANLEGFLFPDTYKIFKDATAADLIKKMLDNFDNKLTSALRAAISRQGKTIFDIITMASIIEKEVRSTDDMKIVSGIFWDRLDNQIALNSCATLAYILGVNKAQYSLADTKINSPYNTYKYRGLPPGPIANPGLNAITAAIYPTKTAYSYFLTDPATGKTIYSRTLDEHNANKAKYLK